MQNAHLRLGLLEYHRITEKTSTRIRVRVSSYIGEDEQAHLIGSSETIPTSAPSRRLFTRRHTLLLPFPMVQSRRSRSANMPRAIAVR